MRVSQILVLFAAASVAGCGYTLRGARSELLDKEGVRSIYVRPLANNTFKPGVENVVYNALIRSLLTQRRVRVVQSESDADAILEGNVSTAQFGISGATTAKDLAPANLIKTPLPGSGLDLTNTSVATVYTATLGCGFMLNRRVVPPGKSRTLWTSGFSRSKPFPAANQLDVPGTTSALINESEFDRALGEMAVAMTVDVQESMLSMF